MSARVSPERALYEADPWAAPDIPWEELFATDKDKYRGMAQAAIKASPELAEALEQLAEVKRIVSEAVSSTSSGGRFSTVSGRVYLARRILAVIGT